MPFMMTPLVQIRREGTPLPALGSARCTRGGCGKGSLHVATSLGEPTALVDIQSTDQLQEAGMGFFGKLFNRDAKKENIKRKARDTRTNAGAAPAIAAHSKDGGSGGKTSESRAAAHKKATLDSGTCRMFLNAASPSSRAACQHKGAGWSVVHSCFGASRRGAHGTGHIQ